MKTNLVYWSIDIVETSVHHKSTFSGIYTNYRPFIATDYKSSLKSL